MLARAKRLDHDLLVEPVGDAGVDNVHVRVVQQPLQLWVGPFETAFTGEIRRGSGVPAVDAHKPRLYAVDSPVVLDMEASGEAPPHKGDSHAVFRSCSVSGHWRSLFR